MLKRRQFLETFLLLLGMAGTRAVQAETEFERYQREQLQGLNQQKQGWEAYKKNYAAAFAEYKNTLAATWASPEISGQKLWVEYSDNLQVRRSIDFEKNEIRLSFTLQEAANFNSERLQQEFSRVISTTVQHAYQTDPVLRASAGVQAPAVATRVSGLNSTTAAAQLALAQQFRQHTRKGDVITVIIPLPPTALVERAKTYLPLVRQQAQRWQVPAALVLAIMHTESAFNPLARSRAPAFGLMQIVPSSAGRDATQHAWGQATLLTGAQLFNPATNIELGCAYLNLLDSRYLNAIIDPTSRLYCVICAYNTGAGNVAKAFTDNTSITAAAVRINRMSSVQVYNQLHKNLPYQETRDYLVRVTQRLPNYQA